MKLTKKDKLYIARKIRLRKKQRDIEEIILNCLEDRSFKQARDIVDVVLQSFPDVRSLYVMQLVYNIMHVSSAWMPYNYEDDCVLL